MAALELLPMSAPAGAAGAVESLRARVERRASRGVCFGLGTGHGYALKAWAPKERPRAHLVGADEIRARAGGQLCQGRPRSVRAPGRSSAVK